LDGLGWRIILIVLISIAPLATNLVINDFEDRADYILTAQRGALDLARISSISLLEEIHQMEELTSIVGSLPIVEEENPEDDCSLFLSNLAARYPWAQTIWIAQPGGKATCQEVVQGDLGGAETKAYVQDALRVHHFTIGDVMLRENGPHYSLVGALPLYDGLGAPRAVVGVSADLSYLAQPLERIARNANAAFLLIDSEGRLIARYPESDTRPGAIVADKAIAAAILAQDDGVGDVINLEGTPCLIGFTKLPNSKLHLAVGLDKRDVVAKADSTLLRNLTFTFFAALLSVTLAWISTESLVRRWVRSLARTMRAIGGGNLKARANVPDTLGEISDLSSEINRMAINLQSQTQELIEAKDDAVRASRAKADFLATMSHEIRTPLTGIIGFAELVLQKRLTAEQRRYMTYQRDAAQALLEIINDVLDFSKIEAEMLTLDIVPLDLGNVIERCVALLAPSAAQKGLELVYQIDDGVPRQIMGDPGRLRQIILNLLSNAVKYTDSGSVRLTVDLAPTGEARVDEDGVTMISARDGDPAPWLRFSTSDTGIGVPRDLQRRLFTKFSQMAGSERATGGTGLGLAITKRLVELMGGEIGVSSVEGVGSNFWFIVPLVPVPPGSEFAPRSNPYWMPSLPPRDGSPVLPPKADSYVLLADDQPSNQELVATMLRRAGYRVDVVSNGAEAVEAIQAHAYDIALLDIEMPIMDGIAATLKIRAAEDGQAHIPIIALSAHDDSPRMQAAREAGIDDHANKPFDWPDLLQKLAFWIGRSAAEPPQGQSNDERVGNVQVLDRPQLSQLIEALGEDKALGYVAEVVAELGKRIDELSTKYEDCDHVGHQAHELIGLAGNVGLAELSALARILMGACARNDDINELIEQLEPALVRARITLYQTYPSIDPST
jgi:signal transduction histidine kinase/CheY-like chemotaxis protein